MKNKLLLSTEWFTLHKVRPSRAVPAYFRLRLPGTYATQFRGTVIRFKTRDEADQYITMLILQKS